METYEINIPVGASNDIDWRFDGCGRATRPLSAWDRGSHADG